MKKISVQDLVLCAMFIVIITICSWIVIPFTVPFTLQTFAVYLTLLILGGVKGTISISVYLIMGMIGIPVFSAMRGGLGVLFGSTGGYLVGFLAICIVYIIGERIKVKNERIRNIAALVIGTVLCYAIGTIWFRYLYIQDKGAVTYLAVLSWCVFPFIIPDAIKMVVAFSLSRILRRYVKRK